MTEDKIRQYDAVLPSLKKNEALRKIYQMVRVRAGLGLGLGCAAQDLPDG